MDSRIQGALIIITAFWYQLSLAEKWCLCVRNHHIIIILITTISNIKLVSAYTKQKARSYLIYKSPLNTPSQSPIHKSGTQD